MQFLNIISAAGIAALSIGSAMADSTTTATWDGKVTTVTYVPHTHWSGPPDSIDSPTPVPAVERDYTVTYTAKPQTVTESDTTFTVPATTMALTMGGGFLTPPAAAPTKVVDARDHTSISFSMETTTYTMVVPATTISTGTDVHTFSAWTETVTWTKLDTFHVTVPGYAKRTDAVSPVKTTMETVVTPTVTPGVVPTQA